MLRFLASRRWVTRIVAGLTLATACVLLGLWQLDRNEQRQARNAVIEANLGQAPTPVEDVLSADRLASADDEWRAIRVSGRYDAGGQLVLRLRPQGGQSGVHVLAPLVTASGTAILVDRGFLAAAGADVPELPPPTAGTVDVVGRLRLSEEGRDRVGDPASGMIRYVDLDVLTAAMAYPLYGGWLELVEQDPPQDETLALVPPPEPEPGPHLSYAIQWFAFATIGVGGFVLLVRAEARARREDAADHSRIEPVGETTGTPTR